LLVTLNILNPDTGAEVVRSNESSSEDSSRVPGDSLPIRLKIPALNLDTEIEYVGLTPDGKMDTPKDITKVAWYEEGAMPGEEGSAVIAGHYGWTGGKASAFDKLHTLKEGDTIYVEDEAGDIVSFTVSHIRNYSPEDDAADVFTSTDKEAHLNLITCAGEWNRDTESYAERLIIFSTRTK
jgi:LPXTG-site transpeptidase (sortase) family protein